MNKEAFLRKYEEVYRDMYRYALLLLGHNQDAEDAVSDAVCDAYRQRDSLRDINAFRGWIFRILSRKCTAKRKAYATQKTLSLDESTDPDDKNTPLIDQLTDNKDQEESTLMQHMLNSLDEDDRNIILLHIFGGYTSEEIANIMGMKASTVRSREHRSLKKLREDMT